MLITMKERFLAMIKGILFLIILFFSVMSMGQTISNDSTRCQFFTDEVSQLEVCIFPDSLPVFPGGDRELLKFLRDNFKVAYDFDGSFKIYAQFVIDSSGTVVRPRIVRSVDYSLDMEAIRVLNEMPQWSPGYCKEKPVNVLYTVPIALTFQ